MDTKKIMKVAGQVLIVAAGVTAGLMLHEMVSKRLMKTTTAATPVYDIEE
jgi:hypothetical protein